MVDRLISKIFMRFPNVSGEVSEIVKGIVANHKDKTLEMIKSITDADLNYIFTNDWDYLMKNSNYIQSDEQEGGNSKFIREIRLRLDNYFSIIVRNIRDTVPKIVGYHLIRKSQDNMSLELWQIINQERIDIAEMMAEPDRYQLERNSINKQLHVFKKSLNVIKKDPQLSRLLGQANAERNRQVHKAQELKSKDKDPNVNNQHNNNNLNNNENNREIKQNNGNREIQSNPNQSNNS